MELVDRYLEAVRRGLPGPLQDDVVAEFSDNIQSQIEEREIALGRSLSTEEASAILKSIGHPLMVASRYRTHQQLIGPALFPFYVQALKIVLSVVLSVVLIFALLGWASTGDALASAARVWGGMWLTAFSLIGLLTIIFAAIERLQPRGDYTQRWDPRTLPPVAGYRVPRATSAFELVFNLLFIWAVLHIKGIGLFASTALLGNSSTVTFPFAVGPWWHQMIQALVVVWLSQAMLNCINLVRPYWSRLRAQTMAVTHAFLLTVTITVLAGRGFVMVASGVSHPERYANAAAVLNGAVMLGLACLAVVCVIMVVINVRTLMRRPDSLTRLS